MQVWPPAAAPQAHQPLGSFATDGFWGFNEAYKGKPTKQRRKEKELEDLLIEEKAKNITEPGKKERPHSAALSIGARSLPSRNRMDRPLSGLRSRPGTAPPGVRNREQSRPSSATLPGWNQSEFESRYSLAKSAKELRKDYVACKGYGHPQYSKEHLVDLWNKDGMGELRTNSEVSTECEDDDGGSDSDRSDLSDSDRLDRALKRSRRLNLELQTAQGEVEKVTTENKQHVEEIENLNEALWNYEEQNAILEEKEVKYREKLGIQRDEIADRGKFIDRSQMSRADVEEKCMTLAKRISNLMQTLTRKGRAFDRIGAFLEATQQLERLGSVWQSWREYMRNMKLMRQIEADRQGPEPVPGDLTDQIMEASRQIRDLREDIASARSHISGLRASRVCLWSKILNDLHRDPTCHEILYVAWIGWRAVHPGIQHERYHQKLIHVHDNLQRKHTSALERLSSLEQIIADMRKDADADADQRFVITERQRFLQADLDIVSFRSHMRLEKIASMETEHSEELESLKNIAECVERGLRMEMHEMQERWKRRHAEATIKFYVMKRQFNRELEDWKAQVDDLHEALHPEGASGIGRASRPPRVVSRSQGILCAGCLTQIVHRDVRPVKSLAKLQTSQLEEERHEFLRYTLGDIDPNDPAYSWIWHQRKDPLNLQSFCMPRDQESAAPTVPTQGILSDSLRSPSPGHVKHRSDRSSFTRSQSFIQTRRPGSGKLGLREEIAGFRNSWRS